MDLSQQLHEESFTLNVLEELILTLISCALLELDPGHLLTADMETVPVMGPTSQPT